MEPLLAQRPLVAEAGLLGYPAGSRVARRVAEFQPDRKKIRALVIVPPAARPVEGEEREALAVVWTYDGRVLVELAQDS